MVRTDKNDGVSNKLIVLSLFLSVVLCACVAVAVFCLDLKRKEEIIHLRNQVYSYGEEIAYLRQQLEHHGHIINQTASSVNKISGDTHKLTESKPVASEEEDYYYEDNYDYEVDEDENEDEDSEDTTAAAPLFEDRILMDTNSTLPVRSKRRVPLEEGTNVLEVQANEHLPNSHKTADEDSRGNVISHNISHLPEYGQFVELMPVYQEQSVSKEGLVRLRHSRGRKKEKRESEVELMAPYDTDTIAAHYGGDTRKYHIGRHKHYDGNDRMYHPSGVFKDWSASSWINTLGMSSYFKLHDGVLTIQNSGLYLVYAQIFYADFHDTSGYRLYQNDEIVAQCTTMSHSTTHIMKRNTCFTNILLHLKSSDMLKLKEIEGNRYTIFEPTKSFFGLIKLKNV